MPSKAYSHPEERPTGASRRTQDRCAAPSAQFLPSLVAPSAFPQRRSYSRHAGITSQSGSGWDILLHCGPARPPVGFAGDTNRRVAGGGSAGLRTRAVPHRRPGRAVAHSSFRRCVAGGLYPAGWVRSAGEQSETVSGDNIETAKAGAGRTYQSRPSSLAQPATQPIVSGGRRCEAGQELGRRGCITVLRPSRRALLGAPQDEGNALMALRKFLILRRPQSGRLEGRTAPDPANHGFLPSLCAFLPYACCGARVKVGRVAVELPDLEVPDPADDEFRVGVFWQKIRFSN
jgi:hypothetical protein